jgi:methylmalonyl-CoA mutase
MLKNILKKIEAKVEAKLKEKFDDKGLERPKYNGELPPSNNGLGLKF